MYNMNDILAQLQGGQSADQIAKSFTDALNAALQKQNEQNARQAKISDMTNLIKGLIDFISEYYPEVLPEDVDLEITEADVTALIDELDTAVPELVQLTSALKGLEELTAKSAEPVGTAKMTVQRPGAKPVTFEAKNVSFGDAMEKFFRQNNLM